LTKEEISRIMDGGYCLINCKEHSTFRRNSIGLLDDLADE
jgi:hypothetical protein